MAFSVRRGLAWMMLSQGGLFVLQFGGSVAMARLLTPYEMGVYAIAYAVVGILGTIRSLGLNLLLVREPELSADTVTTSFTINAVLAAFSAAAIAMVSAIGGAWLGEPGVPQVLHLLALIPLLSILELVPAACLERTGAFRAVGLINLAKTSLLTAVTILLALHGFSYMSIAWGNLAATFLGVVCLNLYGRRFVSLRFGYRDWRRVTGFGIRILMIGAMGTIAGKVSDVLVGRLVGLSALGLYSRASGLNNLLWDSIHTVVARVALVDFAERNRRALPLRDTYLKVVAMITALLWPAFAGLAILAGPVVLLIYGPTWLGAAPLLSLLSVAGIFLTSITMFVELFLVSGGTDQLFRLELKRNCVGLTLFALGSWAGLIWVAASKIADALFAVFLYGSEVRHITGTHETDFASIYFQSVALTAAACTPAGVLMTVNHWSEHTPLPAVLFAVALGVAAWMTGLWLLQHPLFLEAQGAVRQLWQRYPRGV